MPTLDLKKFFGLEDKKALVQDIKKAAGKGAGKSLSMTRKFQENGQDIYARVKLSNSENSTRRRIGLDPDIGDAVAEAVASKISYALSKSGYPGAPDVSFFTDGKGGVGLVSRYVPGGQGSIDDVHRKMLDEAYYKKTVVDPWVKERGNKPLLSSAELQVLKSEMTELDKTNELSKEQYSRLITIKNTLKENTPPASDKKYSASAKLKSHAIITAGTKEGLEVDLNNPNILKVGGELKKEMYSEIVRRMILGDHDNNPGNSLIVKDTNGKDHVAGIDYGHAFNDLIKKFGPGGGHLPDGGGMLDAINRTSINGGKSKFHRDYRGVVADPDFAQVLRDSSSNVAVDEMGKAVISAAEEIRSLKNSGVKEKDLRASLQTVCARMNAPIKNPDKLSFDAILTHFQGLVTQFIEKNMEEAESVANILNVQHAVDKALKSDKDLNPNEIEKLYSQDNKYLKGKNFNDQITWVKNEEDASPQKCSLKEYIEHRSKQLGAQDKAKDLLGILNDEKHEQKNNSLFNVIKNAIKTVLKYVGEFLGVSSTSINQGTNKPQVDIVIKADNNATESVSKARSLVQSQQVSSPPVNDRVIHPTPGRSKQQTQDKNNIVL